MHRLILKLSCECALLFILQLKCDNCLEVTPKEVCVSLDELVPIPNSRDHANLFEKVLFLSTPLLLCLKCSIIYVIKIMP